ncbi:MULTISPECIES: hypothetical protein [Pseudomonas]|uniref:hypothetical protein n=1 Tax=Pseudomonas TaxID=286 RepID=UPI00070F3153|nr:MULTISPECIES: hypothetical protein [Pseudomonas]KQW19809.1 hypothetical protein ASC85_08140 [Pseudomonas sp. Root401]WHS57391.1 hypothetical protein QLH64_30710 [Pseudomonas brassicacearum]
MYRVLIERDGQTYFQKDVATEAYAVYEARELADVGNGVMVAPGADLARYETPTGVIRAVTR